MTRQIYAAYDEQGIFVYQAFKPSIAESALAKGTFDKGFTLDRMTWIKPSFGWMLHRSAYATKNRQEAILKIKISHEGFLYILSHSVETSHNPKIYADNIEWKKALDSSEVRHQWDPDRQLNGQKLERRAIQIGIEGKMVQRYVHEWIIGLEDVTPLAHAIKQALDQKHKLPNVPVERVYEVSDALKRRLAVTSAE